jgi:DMSO/TMAO reductase YedYZ molybdopterin-dependent catalytic subunit
LFPTIILIVSVLIAPATAMGQITQPLQELLPDGSAEYNFSTAGRQIQPIDQLNLTGTPQEVDISTWRLQIKGVRVSSPLQLTYEELSRMPRVKATPLLICPGVFEDFAEWEGVPLSALLEKAKAKADWTEIVITSLDRFATTFTRQEFENHLMYVALKVNGQTLPKEHGFPARLVAVEILGGRWVKWISSIEVR